MVVPAFNEKECIAATVRSLVASTQPVEIIVVDDGSTDGTAELVEGLGLSGVRLLRQPNSGKPAALNTGIAAASHDIVVLIDGDTIVRAGHRRRIGATVRRPDSRRASPAMPGWPTARDSCPSSSTSST